MTQLVQPKKDTESRSRQNSDSRGRFPTFENKGSQKRCKIILVDKHDMKLINVCVYIINDQC